MSDAIDDHIPFEEVDGEPPFTVTIVWEKGSETHPGATAWERRADQVLEVEYDGEVDIVEYPYGNVVEVEQ